MSRTIATAATFTSLYEEVLPLRIDTQTRPPTRYTSGHYAKSLLKISFQKIHKQILFQLKDISRCVENLSDEIRLRDEIIRTTEQERDLLCTTNAALEEKNCKLKCKIKECEQDVNGT